MGRNSRTLGNLGVKPKSKLLMSSYVQFVAAIPNIGKISVSSLHGHDSLQLQLLLLQLHLGLLQAPKHPRPGDTGDAKICKALPAVDFRAAQG
jgi:hypothetical protein